MVVIRDTGAPRTGREKESRWRRKQRKRVRVAQHLAPVHVSNKFPRFKARQARRRSAFLLLSFVLLDSGVLQFLFRAVSYTDNHDAIEEAVGGLPVVQISQIRTEPPQFSRLTRRSSSRRYDYLFPLTELEAFWKASRSNSSRY